MRNYLKKKDEINKALCKAKDSMPNPIDYKQKKKEEALS